MSHTIRTTFALAFAVAACATPALAAPHVTSPLGPRPGQWAFGVGAALLVTDESPVPFARFDFVRGMGEHWSLGGEVDTIGIATMAMAGPRFRIGETVVVGLGARAGFALVPGAFATKDELVPYVVGAPGASLGVTGDWGALTAQADALLIGSDEGAVVPRLVGTLELDFEEAGALSTSGGALLDSGEARTFAVFAVGWVW